MRSNSNRWAHYTTTLSPRQNSFHKRLLKRGFKRVLKSHECKNGLAKPDQRSFTIQSTLVFQVCILILLTTPSVIPNEQTYFTFTCRASNSKVIADSPLYRGPHNPLTFFLSFFKIIIHGPLTHLHTAWYFSTMASNLSFFSLKSTKN